MKIGIIVAMSKELSLLLPVLEGHDVVEAEDYVFHCGKCGKNEVVAMQCGIGKVNAAVGVAAMISRFSPDAVINSGVAGGADPRVNVMCGVVPRANGGPSRDCRSITRVHGRYYRRYNPMRARKGD